MRADGTVNHAASECTTLSKANGTASATMPTVHMAASRTSTVTARAPECWRMLRIRATE